MEDPLVVLTYPGHFMLTALTVKSYLKFHNPKDIIIVVDDISEHAWPQYVDDCKNFYNQKIVSASSLNFLKTITNGWVRQQVLKLHLDLLVPFTNWFFTDGDIVFRYPAIKKGTPYCITRGREVKEKQNNFVKFMLGTMIAGIYTQNDAIDWMPDNVDQVCVSNPPFRSMSAVDLVALRNHVSAWHKKPFNDVLIKSFNFSSCLTSEWELLENFKTYVQKQPPELVFYPTCELDYIKKSESDPDFCEHYFMSDSDFGREIFSQLNLNVSDSIWSHLEKISKLR